MYTQRPFYGKIAQMYESFLVGTGKLSSVLQSMDGYLCGGEEGDEFVFGYVYVHICVILVLALLSW